MATLTPQTQVTEGDWVLPDPQLRRAALGVVLTSWVAGAAVILWFLPWLSRAFQDVTNTGDLGIPLACYLFLAGSALLSVLVVWFGLYAVRLARRTLATGQYPPPGMKVIRKVRLVRGRLAVFTGRGQLAAGAALVMCGVALFAVTMWGFAALAG